MGGAGSEGCDGGRCKEAEGKGRGERGEGLGRDLLEEGKAVHGEVEALQGVQRRQHLLARWRRSASGCEPAASVVARAVEE